MDGTNAHECKADAQVGSILLEVLFGLLTALIFAAAISHREALGKRLQEVALREEK